MESLPEGDRRTHAKIRLDLGAVLHLGGGSRHVRVTDISRGGAFVEGVGELAVTPGDRLELEIARRRLAAEVVRRVDTGVGLRFLEAPIDLRPILPPSDEFEHLLSRHPDHERAAPLALAAGYALYKLARTYFDLEVRGVEHIPYGSRFIWTHNHSGWVSLDAPLIGYLVARHNTVDRYHWTREEMGWGAAVQHFMTPSKPGEWGVTFWNKAVMNWPVIAQCIRAMHGRPASDLRDPARLREFRIFATPAEGEEGNCKSSFTELYQLQRFRTGVARLAMEAELDYIAPAVILGPEESFPNLGKLRGLKRFVKTILPLPLPVPPLPVKWVVRFLPPIDVRRYHALHGQLATADEKHDLYLRIMDVVRRSIEGALQEELRGRRMFRPWFLGV